MAKTLMDIRQSRRIMKWALFFFNLLFWVLGISVFAVGIYVKTDHSDYATIMNEQGNGYSVVLISVGVIVMVVGLVGCVGTLRENRILLVVYASAVALIFLLECAAGGLGYQFRHKLQQHVIGGMNSTIIQFDYTNNNNIRNAWRSVQTQRECCGVVHADDWLHNDTTWSIQHTEAGQSMDELPPTCCPMAANQTCVFTGSRHFHKSCYGVVYENLQKHWKTLAGTAIAVACIQLVGIALSVVLSESIRKYGRYSQFG